MSNRTQEYRQQKELINDTAKTDTERRFEYLLDCHSDTVRAIAYYVKKRNEITAELISLRKSGYEQETGRKVGFLKDEPVEVRAKVVAEIIEVNTEEYIESVEDSIQVVRNALNGKTRYAIEALDRERYGRSQVKYVG